MSDSEQKLLTFPCIYPIKVMGAKCEEFDLEVISIIRQHVPDLGEAAVKTRDSRNGRFLAVTITINATSQEQLDAIYMALSSHPKVLMAL